MDAIEQESANAELFNGSTYIYLYCCDFSYTFSFTVPSLPFLKLSGLFAHFSFFDSRYERRMCILPLSRELLQKFDGESSPVVVDVQSSVIFEFQPGESEEKSMLLIWNFRVVRDLSEKVTPQEPQLPTAEILPIAPLLDIEKIRKGMGCNCSTFPVANDIFVNLGSEDKSQEEVESCGVETGLEECGLSDEEYQSSHEVSNDENSDDETTHTLPFKCIGAAHEKERQEFLKIAATKSKEKKLEVTLRPEPTNEKDKNAIAIDINHGSGYFHCGYIASELTKYLHPLIATDRIIDVSVEHIILRVYFARMGYYPKILITRKGAWEKFVIYRCRSTI